MDRPHHENPLPARSHKRRNRRGGPHEGRRHHHVIPLTEDGVPAATPDAPRPSPSVFVTDESRVEYPWLPPRVIAGSVWRGPTHVRVRVDEQGRAAPWRCAV